MRLQACSSNFLLFNFLSIPFKSQCRAVSTLAEISPFRRERKKRCFRLVQKGRAVCQPTIFSIAGGRQRHRIAARKEWPLDRNDLLGVEMVMRPMPRSQPPGSISTPPSGLTTRPKDALLARCSALYCSPGSQRATYEQLNVGIFRATQSEGGIQCRLPARPASQNSTIATGR